MTDESSQTSPSADSGEIEVNSLDQSSPSGDDSMIKTNDPSQSNPREDSEVMRANKLNQSCSFGDGGVIRINEIRLLCPSAESGNIETSVHDQSSSTGNDNVIKRSSDQDGGVIKIKELIQCTDEIKQNRMNKVRICSD